MFEYITLIVIVAATLGVLWLARRHGIILRPDASGLEAIPEDVLRREAVFENVVLEKTAFEKTSGEQKDDSSGRPARGE